MATIIVMNNATEQMLGRRLNQRQALFAAQAAMRNLWLARPDDIVVATRRPDEAFLRYLAGLLGWETRADGAAPVQFVSPERGPADVVLNDEALLEARTLQALRRAMGSPAGWSLLACYQTAGTARLQEELGLEAVAGGCAIGRRFAAQFGTDLLNRKSHFRQFAAGLGLPVPDGAVVDGLADFARAIDGLLPVTGRVMVKLDNGAGGTGNYVLSTQPVGPLPGACRSIALPQGRGGARTQALAALWQHLQDSHAGPVVVEVHHLAEAMVYLEFVIEPDGDATFLNTGSIRMRPSADPAAEDMVWVGLELPAALPPAILAEAMLHCSRLLGLAAAIGYRGHINIDAIVSREGRLLFNEANARWGGGTVLHEVASRLLGPDFAATHVAASFRDVPSPGFAQLVALLGRSGLAYDARRRDGIVVLACDDRHTHSFEALVLARSSAEARAMERRLMEVLGADMGLAA